MSGNCEFKRRVCAESIQTDEGGLTVLELIEKFISRKESHSGPVSACSDSFNQNRVSEAYRVAEAYSKSGVFNTCTKCREMVRKHLTAKGVL